MLRAKRGERQRIRSRSCRYRKYGNVALEQGAHLFREALCERIGAVGPHRAVIGRADRLENFGRRAGRIVADEVHAGPWPSKIFIRICPLRLRCRGDTSPAGGGGKDSGTKFPFLPRSRGRWRATIVARRRGLLPISRD